MNSAATKSYLVKTDRRTELHLPKNWPTEWNSGEIPFVFNFYSIGVRRLKSLVKKGHNYIEKRSCLKFKEYDPRKASKKANFTFLHYNFSGVLESCCLLYFTKPYGRRMVLITPTCAMPAEVAHASLHGMGLLHEHREPFREAEVRGIFFFKTCGREKEELFDSKM
ncbi:zinc metalloproteinase nas-26-like [Spodoptera litura]|uniref:Zinc metalloproteinase nas-26-like n=1 Tax=Spodoptera litura TaxID=69820 RepID=A0A9J7E9X1_SPOLT|nr:zinc metalloproteinase nas-26-like [Spodoptera litura]